MAPKSTQHHVLLNGEFLHSVPVLSGVPQGTLLDSLMILFHINDSIRFSLQPFIE